MKESYISILEKGHQDYKEYLVRVESHIAVGTSEHDWLTMCTKKNRFSARNLTPVDLIMMQN